MTKQWQMKTLPWVVVNPMSASSISLAYVRKDPLTGGGVWVRTNVHTSLKLNPVQAALEHAAKLRAFYGWLTKEAVGMQLRPEDVLPGRVWFVTAHTDGLLRDKAKVGMIVGAMAGVYHAEPENVLTVDLRAARTQVAGNATKRKAREWAYKLEGDLDFQITKAGEVDTYLVVESLLSRGWYIVKREVWSAPLSMGGSGKEEGDG